MSTGADKQKLDAGAKDIRKAETKVKGKLDGTIDAVARKIAELHDEIMAAAKMSLEKAIEIGGLLTRVRASRKGKWLQWLQDNVPFSHDTAQRYMRCYERRDNPGLRTVRNLSDAYALLCPSKADENPKRETSRSKAVDGLVSTGTARDERDARRILRKQAAAEDEPEPEVGTEHELAPDAPKPQPGWQPDVLGPDDLTPEELAVVKNICAYLGGAREGRAKMFLRFLREGDYCK